MRTPATLDLGAQARHVDLDRVGREVLVVVEQLLRDVVLAQHAARAAPGTTRATPIRAPSAPAARRSRLPAWPRCRSSGRRRRRGPQAATCGAAARARALRIRSAKRASSGSRRRRGRGRARDPRPRRAPSARARWSTTCAVAAGAVPRSHRCRAGRCRARRARRRSRAARGRRGRRCPPGRQRGPRASGGASSPPQAANRLRRRECASFLPKHRASPAANCVRMHARRRVSESSASVQCHDSLRA